jgi:hypothetical protein
MNDLEKLNEIDEVITAWLNDKVGNREALIRITGIVKSP